MEAKNSLRINQCQYKDLLTYAMKHNCYLDSFNTTRHQHENFLEEPPGLDDFTTNVDTLNVSLPYPVSYPHVVKNCIDCCKTLILEKETYNEKLKSFLNRYKKDKKWLTKKYVKNTKYGMLPKYVFDLAIGNIKDPDTHFRGNYNWYYTGGVLDICTIFNEKHLVYPNSDNVLYLRNNTEENYTIKIREVDKSPIFNIKTYDDCIVSIRQKHKVCIVKLKTENDNLSFKVLTRNRSDNIPYIDAKYNDNKLSTLNLNQAIEIRDVDRYSSEIIKFDDFGVGTHDQFGQFEYLNNNNIIFMNRNSVRIYDRLSQKKKRYEMKTNWFKCEELCGLLLSSDTNYVFLSSVHNIIKFDLRQMNIVKKWAHMLSSPPLMMKTEKLFGDELIFASAQNHDERIVLLSNMFESNLVQIVPSNMDTLQRCNREYNFHLNAEAERRLGYSVAGISLMENKEGVDLYTCNGLGDIFKSTASREPISSAEPLKNLDEWIATFPRIPKPLIISHLREVSHIKNALEEPIISDNLERYTKENRKRLDLLSDMTIEDVDMAAIWLSEEDQRGNNLLSSNSSRSKVDEWLQQGEDNHNLSDNYY